MGITHTLEFSRVSAENPTPLAKVGYAAAIQRDGSTFYSAYCRCEDLSAPIEGSPFFSDLLHGLPFQLFVLLHLFGLCFVERLARFYVDRHFEDFPGEFAWLAGLIIFADRRSVIDADVGSFIRRENTALSMVDSSLGNFLTIHRNRSGAAFAHAAIVGKIKTDRCFPWSQSLRGADGIALQAEIVVGIRRLAVLYI